MSAVKDIIGRIAAYENEEMTDPDAVVALFQDLVDSGLAWKLQGAYGRTADSMIRAGLVTRKEPGR